MLGRYLTARASGEWASACADMSAALKGQLLVLAGRPPSQFSECVAAYQHIASGGGSAEWTDPFSGALTAFRRRGPNAFALFYGPGKQQYMMPMVSEGGGWNVNQLAPIPYPPGAPPSE